MESGLLHTITETELLFRLGKWVALCKEKKTETEVESFPELKETIPEKEDGLLSKGMEAVKIGAEMAGKIANSGAAKTIGRFVPGAGIALDALQWAAGTGTQKLKHQQIKEIALRYLIILETEAENIPRLKEKHAAHLTEFEKNCREAESKKSWF
jgi:hypothetical protein